MLPDSNINEPSSHGYVKYRIAALPGLADGTQIHNTAYIIFDLNSQVVTNTTLNTLVTTLPTGIAWIEAPPGQVLVFPNPFSEVVYIVFPNHANERFLFTLYDLQGKELRTVATNQERIILEKGNLTSGLYFFNLRNVNGNIGFNGKFVVR